MLPGFVDLHVHGGGGAELMSGDAAIATAGRTHARHGTTAEIAASLDDLSDVRARPSPGWARLLGAISKVPS